MIVDGHRHPLDLLDFKTSPGAFLAESGHIHVVGDLASLANRILMDVQVLALASTADNESIAYAEVFLGTLLPAETVPFELTFIPWRHGDLVFVDLYARCAAVTLPCLRAPAPSTPF